MSSQLAIPIPYCCMDARSGIDGFSSQEQERSLCCVFIPNGFRTGDIRGCKVDPHRPVGPRQKKRKKLGEGRRTD